MSLQIAAVGALSWITVVWSMIASASLTLAALYWIVWVRNRQAWAHLLFSLTAASLSAFTFCELRLMRAETTGELLQAIKALQLALFFLLVLLVWFVAIYLRAGRRWLAWTACGIRAIFVLLTFFGTQNPNFTEITSLQRVRFLGESVTVLSGVPNPMMLFGQLGVVLILVFVADASIQAWRRGDRRLALMIGGSTEFLLFTGLVMGAAIVWGYVQAPLTYSLLYLGVLIVMGFELSTGLFRASELATELQVSNRQISELFGRLIAAQETERTRIARDLHDDVSQRIAGLSIMISRARRMLGQEPREAGLGDTLNSMQASTIALAEEIRHISHDLHPGPLQHLGLDAALGAYCSEVRTRHPIEVTYTGDPDAPRTELGAALCLYRITQEALHNVVKHADARHVVVTLTHDSRGIQLAVVDDGRGFDLAAARARNGLGLVSIDERARLLRGTVRLETQPQSGTNLQVEIPWPVRS